MEGLKLRSEIYRRQIQKLGPEEGDTLYSGPTYEMHCQLTGQCISSTCVLAGRSSRPESMQQELRTVDFPPRIIHHLPRDTQCTNSSPRFVQCTLTLCRHNVENRIMSIGLNRSRRCTIRVAYCGNNTCT